MAYQSRIPVAPTYIHSVGTAFYNFTYLEWVVVWIIVKLSTDGFASVPRGETAKVIATAFLKAIENTSPPLPAPLRRRLIKFHESYLAAIRSRNKLLHAHPYTAQDGQQQLGGGGVEWPISEVDQAAQFFENAAIEGNAIFHGELTQVRPCADAQPIFRADLREKPRRPLNSNVSAMKNIQVIDGAVNSVYDIFAATDEEFSLIFPEGQDVTFIDEVYDRGNSEVLDTAFKAIWSRRIPKREANGIHGLLFYELEEKKVYYPTRKDEEAVNPNGSRLR